jgi:hypothetical protein
LFVCVGVGIVLLVGRNFEVEAEISFWFFLVIASVSSVCSLLCPAMTDIGFFSVLQACNTGHTGGGVCNTGGG